jgi:hypothetical protein
MAGMDPNHPDAPLPLCTCPGQAEGDVEYIQCLTCGGVRRVPADPTKPEPREGESVAEFGKRVRAWASPPAIAQRFDESGAEFVERVKATFGVKAGEG